MSKRKASNFTIDNTRATKLQCITRLKTSLQMRQLSRAIFRPGVHSPNFLAAAGFRYTGVGDTTQCEECKLEVFNWTADMHPFNIHAERKPDCEFVRSIKSPFSLDKAFNFLTTNPIYQSISTLVKLSQSKSLLDMRAIQEVQIRSFSHWDRCFNLPSALMIDAGFFYTNLDDRVICVCCNLICQEWIANTDDPFEVHRTLSPDCPYIQKKLEQSSTTSMPIINDNVIPETSSNHSLTQDDIESSRIEEIVHTAAMNSRYHELPKREESFIQWPNQWPNQMRMLVDHLVQAGFFYTGRETIVCCFYCNGSLRNWKLNDNPMIEHARWFPHCAYAKQLCGIEMHRQIQNAQRARQHNQTNDTEEQTSLDPLRLLIPNKATLSRLVSARLDLPVSKCLLDKYFKLVIVKQCWTDQLRLKRRLKIFNILAFPNIFFCFLERDFHSNDDLYMACLIFQKQIEHIKDNEDNIVIPSIRMRQIREQQGTLTLRISLFSIFLLFSIDRKYK